MISDGIYLNLSNADYHADLALGSTGLKALLKSAAHYWHCSPLNADYVNKKTPAKSFGTALHKYVCEGEKAFLDTYMRQEYPFNTKAGKEQKAEAEAARKELLASENWDKIITAKEAIESNPATSQAFIGGVAEVSIFWKRTDGIRCKARFDYLKPAAIVDLKSLSNSLGKEIDIACYRALAEYDYLLSAAWYLEARRQMKALVTSEKIYRDGKSDYPPYLIPAETVRKCAQIQNSAFVWVFFQTIDEPAVYGIATGPMNQSILAQHQRIEIAIERYRDAMAKFGMERPWREEQQNLDNLEADKLPSWYRS